MKKEDKQLHRVLSAECADLESAKNFVRLWSRGEHRLSREPQVLQLDGYIFEHTMRCMAALVSSILEGKDWPDGSTDYLTTKYGPALYMEM